MKEGRFEDTNKIFEPPEFCRFSYNREWKDDTPELISEELKMFDWKKPTVQMLGRWQPWHEGHQALFKRCSKNWSGCNSGLEMFKVLQVVTAKMIIPLIGILYVKI